jgi:EpsI family protein
VTGSSRWLAAVLLCMAMCAASLTAVRLKVPAIEKEDVRLPGLDSMIPQAFGDWKMLPTPVGAVVNPVVDEVLARTYTELVTRVYVDTQGRRIMLSVAYGSNQSRDLQVHRPEVCYSAQGFLVSGLRKDHSNTSHGALPVMRLNATMGNRGEPITYWLRMGDSVVRGNIEQGLSRISAGLRRRPIDGIVFRVSSIGAAPDVEYRTHDAFIAALLRRLDQRGLWQLTGTALSPAAQRQRH